MREGAREKEGGREREGGRRKTESLSVNFDLTKKCFLKSILEMGGIQTTQKVLIYKKYINKVIILIFYINSDCFGH